MVSRRRFLTYAGAASMATFAGIALSGCSGSRSETTDAAPESDTAASVLSDDSTTDAYDDGSNMTGLSGAIVIYFSRAGENYGVGVVEEGNTAILARMIAEQMGTDAFEIKSVEAYPQGYDECCDVALKEQDAGTRPAYESDVDLAGYGIVYLGYPIWWGDLPMCVYTFLEAHDWSGKEIRPFCTHAGSGLSGTPEKVGQVCEGATLGEGLAVMGVTAQNSRDEARSAVLDWLGA